MHHYSPTLRGIIFDRTLQFDSENYIWFVPNLLFLVYFVLLMLDLLNSQSSRSRKRASKIMKSVACNAVEGLGRSNINKSLSSL